jgi:hypothetical protein
MNSINDFILSQGDEARRMNEEKPKARSKVNYVSLKDGESLRGFLLTTDFKMYVAHGDYNKRIKTHTCRDPKHGKDCLSCQHGIKRTKKTIVPFFNADTQQVEIFDASVTAMKAIYCFIDQYEEDSTMTPIVLSRTGNSKSTTYTLMPTRVRAAETLLFELPTNIVIDDDLYSRVLNVPSDEYVLKLIGLAE